MDKERERLKEFDKADLEKIKLAQEIKALESPYWKKNAGVIISAASLVATTIFAIIHLGNWLDEETKKIRESTEQARIETIAAQKQVEDMLKESSIREQQNRIVALNHNIIETKLGHLEAISKVNIEFEALNAKKMEVEAQKSEIEKKIASLKLDSAELQNQNRMLSAVKNRLDTANRLLQAEVMNSGFLKDKQEALKICFSLKSNIVDLITPRGDKFSGKLMNLVSNVNINKTESDAEGQDILRTTLNSLDTNSFIQSRAILRNRYNDLKENLDKYRFISPEFDSNRYIHYSRRFLAYISPAIDSLILAINTTSN